jgi:hypothetical protein
MMLKDRCLYVLQYVYHLMFFPMASSSLLFPDFTPLTKSLLQLLKGIDSV